MAGTIKEDDNTPVQDINTITNPNTKTLVDRYVFASNFCKEKSVMDCPTGHGYGAVILKALGAKSVLGLDIDTKAIIGNRERYQEPTVGFDYGDMTSAWSCKTDSEKVDVIVSIEGFEHIPRDKVPQMLMNFKDNCRKNGTIFITTPLRHVETFEYQGGTHMHEYNVNEFTEELHKVFKSSSVKLWFAVEFVHPFSQELNTVFSPNIEHSKYAPVMIAVITNE